MIWPNLGHQDHAEPGGRVGIDVRGEAEIPGMVLEGVLGAKPRSITGKGTVMVRAGSDSEADGAKF